MGKHNIADLTIAEFHKLVRQVVQEAMAEVMVEFSVAMERDANLAAQAEITDWLRSSLHSELMGTMAPAGNLWPSDD